MDIKLSLRAEQRSKSKTVDSPETSEVKTELEFRVQCPLTWLFESRSMPLMTLTSAPGAGAPPSSVMMRFVVLRKRVHWTVAPKNESS